MQEFKDVQHQEEEEAPALDAVKPASRPRGRYNIAHKRWDHSGHTLPKCFPGERFSRRPTGNTDNSNIVISTSLRALLEDEAVIAASVDPEFLRSVRRTLLELESKVEHMLKTAAGAKDPRTCTFAWRFSVRRNRDVLELEDIVRENERLARLRRGEPDIPESQMPYDYRPYRNMTYDRARHAILRRFIADSGIDPDADYHDYTARYPLHYCKSDSWKSPHSRGKRAARLTSDRRTARRHLHAETREMVAGLA